MMIAVFVAILISAPFFWAGGFIGHMVRGWTVARKFLLALAVVVPPVLACKAWMHIAEANEGTLRWLAQSPGIGVGLWTTPIISGGTSPYTWLAVAAFVGGAIGAALTDPPWKKARYFFAVAPLGFVVLLGTFIILPAHRAALNIGFEERLSASGSRPFPEKIRSATLEAYSYEVVIPLVLWATALATALVRSGKLGDRFKVTAVVEESPSEIEDS